MLYNNKKETVLSLFEEAISEAGVPSRIRTDKGGENEMIELRGENRESHLAPSSVHNQLWKTNYGMQIIDYDT